ncbi:LOW QUALITY PROTEIN: hypothetical protein V1477_002196 [Vespula maculifrons]|uniref:Uncharacterized protein n=1 Tax=Vespula maculifrons TaxID=7453 RepID=A0ABD2CVX1_VESMC
MLRFTDTLLAPHTDSYNSAILTENFALAIRAYIIEFHGSWSRFLKLIIWSHKTPIRVISKKKLMKEAKNERYKRMNLIPSSLIEKVRCCSGDAMALKSIEIPVSIAATSSLIEKVRRCGRDAMALEPIEIPVSVAASRCDVALESLDIPVTRCSRSSVAGDRDSQSDMIEQSYGTSPRESVEIPISVAAAQAPPESSLIREIDPERTSLETTKALIETNELNLI